MPNQANATPEVIAVTVVRGEAHTAFYAEAVLPALLWPGNLPAVAGRARLRYLLHTTPDDAKRLRAAPAFARLEAVAEVRLVPLDPEATAGGDKDAVAAACHREALPEIQATGAAMLLLSPDCLYADGALAHAWGWIAAGKRAVMLASLPLERKTLWPALRRRWADSPEAPAPMGPRELCALGLSHRRPADPAAPAALFFEAGPEGGLAHCFHVSPVLLRPENPVAGALSPLDPGYLLQACPDPRDIRVIEDSDDALGLLLADGDGSASEPVSAERVTAWARESANWQQRRFFGHALAFRAAAPGAGFARAAAAADPVVAAVLDALAPPPVPAAVRRPLRGPAPLVPGPGREPARPFVAFMDFAASPYALGDILTWNVRVCCEALAVGADVVDVVVLNDPEKLGNAFQGFVNASNYKKLFLDLLPAYYTNPLLRHLAHVYDRGVFEELMARARDGGQGQFPGFKKYGEGLRAREALYSGHWFMNRFHAANGFVPGLTVPPAQARWAEDFRRRLGPGTVAVTVHIRRREADSLLFGNGIALERDGDFSTWETFFDIVTSRHPEVRFILLGKPAEWPRRLMRHPRLVILKTLGHGLMEELAMIKAADLFMGLVSGPSIMAFFSTTPYVQFVQEAFNRLTAEVLGVELGTPRLPFASPGQRLVWEPPALDRLLALFEEQYAVLRGAAR